MVIFMNSNKRLLLEGLAQMNLSFSSTQAESLWQHLVWLKKWNGHYNLTAITDERLMISHHILDSLSVLPYLRGESFLDMGTGAGFPGLPLAIMSPEKRVCLLDGNGKRTRFLVQLCHHLGLKNVTIVHSRAERYRSSTLFDAIISRAVADIDQMLENSQHLLAKTGRYYWMKGQYPEQELCRFDRPFEAVELEVPGLDAQRHLIIVDKETWQKS